jgi:DNA-binding NarL/FixJ family response regulator
MQAIMTSEHLVGRPLTRCEQMVIDLIAQGLQSKEIGARLSLSTCTVNTYTAKLLRKTASANRIQLATKWVQGQLGVKGQAPSRA